MIRVGRTLLAASALAAAMLACAPALAVQLDVFGRRELAIDPNLDSISARAAPGEGESQLALAGLTTLAAIPQPRVDSVTSLDYDAELVFVPGFGDSLAAFGAGGTVLDVLTGAGPALCAGREPGAWLRDRRCRRLLRLDRSEPELD